MKIYREEKETKQELKKPLIRFAEKKMRAVDENGIRISTLIDFENCTFIEMAKQCLDGEGYSADWAEWDAQGRMTSLLEDFE